MINKFVKAFHNPDHTLTVRVIGRTRAIRARTVRVLNETERLEKLSDFRAIYPSEVAKRLKLPQRFVDQVLEELYDDPANAWDKLQALEEGLKERMAQEKDSR